MCRVRNHNCLITTVKWIFTAWYCQVHDLIRSSEEFSLKRLPPVIRLLYTDSLEQIPLAIPKIYRTLEIISFVKIANLISREGKLYFSKSCEKGKSGGVTDVNAQLFGSFLPCHLCNFQNVLKSFISVIISYDIFLPFLEYSLLKLSKCPINAHLYQFFSRIYMSSCSRMLNLIEFQIEICPFYWHVDML